MILPIVLVTAFVKVTQIGCANLGSSSNQIATASNEFSSNLYKKLSSQEGNLFYSPLSIATALTMLYNAARGTTAKEMKDVLGYSSAGLSDDQINEEYRQLITILGNSPSDYILELANAAMMQKNFPIRPQYIDVMKSVYKAEVKNVDFVSNRQNALKEINAWVKSKTRNKIDKILDSIDPSTIMVLLNAMYFKGTWLTQFKKTDTYLNTFYNDGTVPKKVDMMRMMKPKVLFHNNYDFSAIELPYKGKDICMRIILPVQKDGLSSLESKLSAKFLREAFKNLTESELEVIGIPKFKIEYEKELNGILSSMGMPRAFSDSADLSGISKGIKVSLVKHKAFIEVNEEGSEAAAATAVTILRTLNPFFIADRPFLFYIVDKRNEMILFCGRVTKL